MRYTLIMDLTGESRDTQVQPPLGAWARFFGIDIDDDTLPTFTLQNANGGAPIQRPVVRHDHTMTLEIPESAPGRPAIIQFQREASDEYRYWIWESGDVEYDHLRWLLDNVPNPRRRIGRRWLAI